MMTYDAQSNNDDYVSEYLVEVCETLGRGEKWEKEELGWEYIVAPGSGMVQEVLAKAAAEIKRLRERLDEAEAEWPHG